MDFRRKQEKKKKRQDRTKPFRYRRKIGVTLHQTVQIPENHKIQMCLIKIYDFSNFLSIISTTEKITYVT